MLNSLQDKVSLKVIYKSESPFVKPANQTNFHVKIEWEDKVEAMYMIKNLFMSDTKETHIINMMISILNQFIDCKYHFNEATPPGK